MLCQACHNEGTAKFAPMWEKEVQRIGLPILVNNYWFFEAFNNGL